MDSHHLFTCIHLVLIHCRFRLVTFTLALLLCTALIESNNAQSFCSTLETDLAAIKASTMKLENSLKASCSNVTPSCPFGWNEFNYHCYLFRRDYKNWTAADTECKIFGGYLAKIENSKENTWLITKSKEYSLASPWIGLQKIGDAWQWTVDSEVASFVYWNGGEPSGDGACGELYWGDTWKWNDESCEKSWNYICENN